MLIVHLLLESAAQLEADVLGVYEVAIATALTLAVGVLPTFGFPEVGDGAVLHLDRCLIVILARHGPQRRLCLLLRCILNIQIANHVLAYVVRHYHVEYFAELAELGEDLFEEILKMMSCLH